MRYDESEPVFEVPRPVLVDVRRQVLGDVRAVLFELGRAGRISSALPEIKCYYASKCRVWNVECGSLLNLDMNMIPDAVGDGGHCSALKLFPEDMREVECARLRTKICCLHLPSGSRISTVDQTY